MKNFLLMVIAGIMVFAVCACGNAEDNDEADKETTTISEKVADDKPQGAIEKTIRERIESEYRDTDVDSIEINKDAGTDKDGDYIALIRLVWNVKNSGPTSKEMLQMYSDDLAATVAKEHPEVNEVAVFWEVPYLNGSAKCQYEKKGDGMAYGDMVWGSEFE